MENTGGENQADNFIKLHTEDHSIKDWHYSHQCSDIFLPTSEFGYRYN
jgi:hypothetical protein